MQRPGGIAVARIRRSAGDDPKKTRDEVTLVALDSATGWILSNGNGVKAVTWGKAPGKTGALRGPTDIALDTAGRIAVCDPGNRRVVFFEHTGQSIREVGILEGFREPVSVAAEGSGWFYVCDRTANRVELVEVSTGKKHPFAVEANFEGPNSVAAVARGEKMARGKEPRVAIADREGRRIRLFTLEGDLVNTWEGKASGVAMFTCDDLDLDYYGNVFVVERSKNRIHKLRDDCLPLDTLTGEPTSEVELQAVQGIAIHRPLGQVFLSERAGGVYLWIGTEVRDLHAKIDDRDLRFEYRLTEESFVTLRVLDTEGQVAATLATSDRQTAGPQGGVWDGTTSRGDLAGTGEYSIEVTARATYSSKSFHEDRALKRFSWKKR